MTVANACYINTFHDLRNLLNAIVYVYKFDKRTGKVSVVYCDDCFKKFHLMDVVVQLMLLKTGLV